MKRLTLTDSEFPEALRQIPDAPKQLFIAGTLPKDLDGRPCLAVVGSRKITPYGKAVTLKLAGEAAKRGVIIVSGLAIGADGLAHQAALEAGGTTIAVLPSGLDTVYPASHRQLAKRIVENGGALITEYPANTEAFKANFLERNRLVSGLSRAVLITEAAERSGTLNTASHALEQGRDVLAVPGNITSPYSAGTNNLIRAGATPITKVEDLFQALGLSQQSQQRELVAANKEEHLILSLIQSGITDASLLLAESGLPTALFNQTLTMLEIDGRIRPTAGHWHLQ